MKFVRALVFKTSILNLDIKEKKTKFKKYKFTYFDISDLITWSLTCQK